MTLVALGLIRWECRLWRLKKNFQLDITFMTSFDFSTRRTDVSCLLYNSFSGKGHNKNLLHIINNLSSLRDTSLGFTLIAV